MVSVCLNNCLPNFEQSQCIVVYFKSDLKPINGLRGTKACLSICMCLDVDK